MRSAAAALVVLALTAPASAQVSRPALPSGITVAGRAAARIVVRTVDIVAFAHGIANTADVLAAMRDAGLENPAVVSSPFSVPAGRAPIQLHGRAANVTPAKLEALAAAAQTFAQMHPGVGIDNVALRGVIPDCAVAEESLRRRALDDAHGRAEALARDAGISLGAPRSIAEAGGCVAAGDDGLFPLDGATLTAALSLTENVTYDVR